MLGHPKNVRQFAFGRITREQLDAALKNLIGRDTRDHPLMLGVDARSHQ
jgi:hypothetical protein